MKCLLVLLIISKVGAYFTGCPIDGCDSSLSGFVDIVIDEFDSNVSWNRTDLLTNASRGCVSNGQLSLLCAVDIGYVSVNITNGQILWSIPLEPEGKAVPLSLPIINYQGYSIIANGTLCTLIDPRGIVIGVFQYNPLLIPPVAGPFVTDGGQIIVADSISFVGIEDSGIPLGVQPLPEDFVRLSRSMSLNRNDNRWYLLAQRHTTSSQAIIAAQTTGSIVGRIRIAWIYEYGVQPSECTRMEGPVFLADQKWLFVVNTTGIVTVADNDHSASTEYFVNRPDLCVNDMAFSQADSTLFMFDKRTHNIILLNVSTRSLSYISLPDICGEKLIEQLSRITVIRNYRIIVSVITVTRKAILLLIDYRQRSLLSRLDLGDVSEMSTIDPLTQLAYTQVDDQQAFVTIAHRAIGLIAVRLLMSNQSTTFE